MIIEIKLDVENENELEIDYMGNCSCGCGKELFAGMTVVNLGNKLIYVKCLQNALENRKVIL